MTNRQQIEEMFLNNKRSAYDIHMKTDIPIKEVYHVLEHCVEAKRRHKEAIRSQRLADGS